MIINKSAGLEPLPEGRHMVAVSSFRVIESEDAHGLSLAVVDSAGRRGWWKVASGQVTTVDIAQASGVAGLSYEETVERLRKSGALQGGLDGVGAWLIEILAGKQFPIVCWVREGWANVVPALREGVYKVRFIGFTPQAVYDYTPDGKTVYAPLPFTVKGYGDDEGKQVSVIRAVFAVADGDWVNFPATYRMKLTHEVRPNLWNMSERSAIAQLGDALGVWPKLEALAESKAGEVLFKDERGALALFQSLAFGAQAMAVVDDSGRMSYGRIMKVAATAIPQPSSQPQAVEEKKAAGVALADGDILGALDVLAESVGFLSARAPDGKVNVVGKDLLRRVVYPLVDNGLAKVSKTWPMTGEDVSVVQRYLLWLACDGELKQVLENGGDWQQENAVSSYKRFMSSK